jgi:large subunit ribosomal protein L29
MKIEHIRDLTIDEIEQKKHEIEEELFNLRLKSKTKQEQNPVRIRVLRKDLARVLTVLREQELGIGQIADSGKLKLDKEETAEVKE